VPLNGALRHTRSVIAVEYGQSIRIRTNRIRGKAGHRSGVQYKHNTWCLRASQVLMLHWTRARVRDFAAGGLVTVGAMSQTQPTTSEVKQQTCPRPSHEGVWGCRGTAPLSLKLGTRWRWVVRFALRPPLSPGKDSGTH